MAYEGLARKWRPLSFGDVVGQEHVTRTLKNAIDTGRIAHAYLFVGPRGIGKTTLARIFAKSLDCEKGPTMEPCLECALCREIAAGNSLDVLEIDGASNNGVDQVRELREHIQFRPTRAKYKIVIIDEVHMLSTGAFNALLKTLEEPPEYVIFIFATTEGDKVLPTIVSRCQRFDLRRIQTAEIIGRLRYICSEEKVSISDDALLAIARSADGGMRDALSSLDQLIAFCGDKLDEEDVLQIFGIVSRKALETLAEALLKGDAKTMLGCVDDFERSGKNMRRLAAELLDYFRNVLVYRHVGADSSIIDFTPEQMECAGRISEGVDTQRLQQILEELSDAESEMRHTLSVRTRLEVALLRCSRLATTVTLDAVLKAVKTLSEQGVPTAAAPAAPAAPPAASGAQLPPIIDSALKNALKTFNGKVVGSEK